MKISPSTFAVLAALAAAATLRGATAKPNVLFIAVDDLRTSLGAYGDPLALTPNLDQLARESRRFERAYTMQAVCGPARTAILTGRLPDHNRHQPRHRHAAAALQAPRLPHAGDGQDLQRR
jgi:iduronate 2-sulfatase